MKKLYYTKLIAFIFCCCVFNSARGQWVAIQPAFANYISTYVDPTAISGSQLDTTNHNVLILQNWTINTYTGLNDITGIQYFKGLKNLVLNASITTLAQLPDSLQTFECHSTSLASFSGAFPNGLRVLKFYNAPFTSFNIGLPPNLGLLIMNNCAQITSLPALPASLEVANIAYSYLVTSLPPLPNSLTDFSLTNLNALSALPTLPNNLRNLYLVSMPALTALPALPNSLDTLLVYSPSVNFVALPALPNNLTTLTVYIPQATFTTLPVLPNSLTYLKIDNCAGLTALPSLPTSLQYLSANSSQLSMAAYPPALATFICENCSNLTSLPVAPQTLSYLDVQNCNIVSMDTFPDVMSYVFLSNNPITNINFLPGFVSEQLLMNNMPNLRNINVGSITFGSDLYLIIYSNPSLSVNNCPHASSSLTTFLGNVHSATMMDLYLDGIIISANHDSMYTVPVFSALLQAVDLSYNPIKRLSSQQALPGSNGYQYPFDGAQSGGTSLNFSHCSIDSLNPLFFTLGTSMSVPVQLVDFSYNNLTTLNWMPFLGVPPGYNTYPGLLRLNNNQITDIQVPIDAGVVHLENNQITCLPYLLEVTNLYVSGNSVTCLPNIPTANFFCDLGLSVCTAGNSNGCPVNSQPGGVVFNDQNQNGVKDVGESSLSGYYVEMDSVNAIHVSDNTGHYIFQCQPYVQYTIKGLPTYNYRIVTTAPYGENFTGFGAFDTLRNIGIYTIPNVNDMAVFLTSFEQTRPGFHQNYNVTAINEGTTIENGTVVMYFDTTLWYQSSNPPGAVSGNKVTWNISNLSPLQSFSANIDFIVPVPVLLGSPIGVGAYALCNVPDTTPYDNHDTILQIAVGSYDPNNKTVSPAGGLSQQEIATGGYLNYTVRFQNTGTASAINVRVEDTLSAALDLGTFQFINASNVNSWSIDNRILKVYFNNIQLPDSGTDQAGSHGFFRYRIKPSTGATTGEQIKNTAHIYFDYNPAITTNTVVNTLCGVTVTHTIASIPCGSSFIVGAHAYDTTGSYTDTLSTALGCDSIVYLQLTIIPAQVSIHQNICQGDSFNFYGTYISAAGNSVDTVHSSLGCDSIIILNLSIIPDSVNIAQSICSNDSFYFNGHYLSAAGTYTEILSNQLGCDSFVILQLNVGFDTVNVFGGLCGGDSVYFYGHWIYHPGEFDTILPGHGTCDTLASIFLAVIDPLPPHHKRDTICANDSLLFAGTYLHTSGVYNHNGCDSSVILTLTVLSTDSTILNQSICGNDSFYFNGNYLSATGTYTQILSNQVGCDSFIILQLNVGMDTILQFGALCAGDSIYFYGTWIYHPTQFDTILPGHGTCDTFASITLAVQDPLPPHHTSATICANDSLLFTGVYLYTAGVYDHIGCDSSVILTLTVLSADSTILTQSICYRDSFYFNNTYLHTAGTYFRQLSNQRGCDSVVALHLSLFTSDTAIVAGSICTGDSFLFNGNYLNTPGTYTATLTGTAGCDSVVLLNLSVFSADSANVSATICFGAEYDIGTTALFNPGNYTIVIPNRHGCDSVVFLSLTVLNPDTTILTQVLCGGDTLNTNGSVITYPGTYRFLYTNSIGCDSIVILHVSVLLDSTTITQTICTGDSFIFHGRVFTAAGNYRDTLTGSLGCDSIILITLIVNPPPVVTLSWDSLVNLNELFGSLQDTIYCFMTGSPLVMQLYGGYPPGGLYSGGGVISNILHGDLAYGNSPLPALDTIYYTYQDNFGCTRTASDIIKGTVCEGILETADDKTLSIYPNPGTNELFIKAVGVQPETITLYEVSGQKLSEGKFVPQINIGQLSSGVYFIEIKAGEQVARKRFVKM